MPGTAADRLPLEHCGAVYMPEHSANLRFVKQSTLNLRQAESYIQHGMAALNARMFHAVARPFRLDTL
jgi:hypothetical protein